MEFKLKPDNKEDSNIKYYTYGPFFVQMIKTYSGKWSVSLSTDASGFSLRSGMKRLSIQLGYRKFRATDRNVEENLKQLMIENRREIISNIL